MTMESSLLPPWEHFKDTFKFSHAEIEAEVEGENLYKNLSPEALYTSLEDLYRIQTHKLVRGTWVDLGAGTGLSALLYGKLYPDRISKGVELALPRLKAGRAEVKRHGLLNVELLQGDLMRDDIPSGETYFLYFPTGMVLDRILHVLSLKNEAFRIIAIESHGDLLARLKQEPCLQEVGSIPLSSPRHHGEALIFEKVQPLRIKNPLFLQSFQDQHLLIQEGEESWVGDSLGLEWLGGKRFNLLHPPRTINSDDVLGLLGEREKTQELILLLTLRRLGEVEIESGVERHSGLVRKILMSPVFSVELSTGERVEWQKIQSIKWNHQLCYKSSSQFFFLPPAP